RGESRLACSSGIYFGRTSHSPGRQTGRTTSPTIRPVEAAEPSQPGARDSAEGGTIATIGFPRYVTRIGLPVLPTFDIRATQFALNRENGTDRMMNSLRGTPAVYPWSTISLRRSCDPQLDPHSATQRNPMTSFRVSGAKNPYRADAFPSSRPRL